MIDMIITIIKNTIDYNHYLKIKFNNPSPFRTYTPKRNYKIDGMVKRKKLLKIIVIRHLGLITYTPFQGYNLYDYLLLKSRMKSEH